MPNRISRPHFLYLVFTNSSQSNFYHSPSSSSFDEDVGDCYYFNFETGQTQWEHPLDEVYQQKVILAREEFTEISGDTSDILTNSNNSGGGADNSSTMDMKPMPGKLVSVLQ